MRPIRIILSLTAFILSFAFNGIGQSTPPNGMQAVSFNFTSFDIDPLPNTTDPELISLTNPSFLNHPEFGQLPYNVRLDSVFEIIDRRTEFTRTLVKIGTNGRTIYIQKGYFPINYLDNNGWWMTIDERLHPSLDTPGLFEANAQLSPTFIDASNKYAGVKNGSEELKFNANITLYHEDVNGNRVLIANANWSNYTAGSQGVKVINVFPGIDLDMLVSNGSIKTNYIINAPMVFPNGWLVIEDHPILPVGQTASFTSTVVDPDGLNFSGIDVFDASNTSKFKLSSAFGYDQSGNTSLNVAFGAKWGTNNEWGIYIPVSWTGNSSLQFPLTVDPLVTSSATYLQGLITGSFQQNTGLFTSSCDYTMAVPTPANCTVTNVLWSFTYIAQNGARLCYGANRFTVNGCLSPSAPGFYWYCDPSCTFAGTCTGTNVSIWADVSACIPAPQCASYNLNCINHFFARAVPNGACSNFYIGANSNWIMTIQGQTIDQPSPPTSSAGTTICSGTITTLTATGQYGVAPYTYSWSPVVSVNQSVNVAPTVTTTYTCVITDACGITSLNSVTITVTSGSLSPAPVVAYSMNPASGNPCPVLVTFCTNVGSSYGGGPESYIWSFPGGTVTAGGATTGSANGPTYGGTNNGGCGGGNSYTVNYTTAGSYWASIQISNGGNCTVLNIPITICGALPIELISFHAYSQNTIVLLNWITASETNNDYFTIERSLDGMDFMPIGTVNGAGNSSENLHYHFTDQDPPSGLIYYRLKQTDFNGNFKNSNIVVVSMDERSTEIYIRPNPVLHTAEIGFRCEISGSAVLNIVDVLGQVVLVKNLECISGNNSVMVDLSGVSKGIYFIQVSTNNMDKKLRFVKD